MKKATDGPRSVSQNETFSISKDGLADAFDFLTRAVATMGLNESVAGRLSVIVDEVCSNLLRHDQALRGQDVFQVSLEEAPSGVVMTIVDPGAPFDITRHSADHVPEIGGHGIALVKGLAEDLQYQRRSDQNELRVILAVKD